MPNTKNAPKTARFWCSAPSLPSSISACLMCLDPPPASPHPSLILVMTNPSPNSTFLPFQDTSNPPVPPPSSEHQNRTLSGMVLVFSCIFAMRHDEWVHLGPVHRVSHNLSLLTTKTRPYGCVFWSWKGRDTLEHPRTSQRAVLGVFRCSTPILILPYHLPIPLRAPT